jgi:HSP20 family protein
MPMDVYRSGDHYVLHADLPGVDPGSVDVGVENSTLTIRAKRSERSEDGVQWIASERFTGTYQRQLALGEDVDTERISASYANGVLTLTLPVADRAKPRRIEIAVDDGSTPVEAHASQAGIGA